MEHSIALVTGATSGLGYAAARSLAEEGWGEIIITGRSLARAKETAAQLAAQRPVRARRASQTRSGGRFPAAQCRIGPNQEARDHCGGR
jgi:NAD(P)-dependent dehydrogenase (short-subunit alcohol dehydrogenase family)